MGIPAPKAEGRPPSEKISVGFGTKHEVQARVAVQKDFGERSGQFCSVDKP
jgi:hypothetical protein